MTLLRESLMEMVGRTSGLDVLILLDCCCAAVAGRGRGTKGQRLELMAATSGGGLSNSRKDGKTFTQNWCQAFEHYIAQGKPFNCDDILIFINEDNKLEQHPATFVVRDGWGIPITFCALPNSITSIPAVSSSRTVIVALHLEEDLDSTPMTSLMNFLQDAPIKITVLAALPISSTLLLIRVPIYLQEMLVVPRVSILRDI
jgi:hypothetical protein